MNSRPTTSVVIPLYNRAAYVERAIRSVLTQGMQDFEIVVVDDGSTDDGPSIVDKIGDSRIRLLHQANAGVSAARNRGIEEARSELIAFLDADDEWMPEFLDTILRLRRNYPECDVFATGYVYRYDNGPDRVPVISGLPDGYEGVLENYFEVASRSDPPLWTSAVTVTRKAIRAVGGFPVGIISGEDLLTWARLAVDYRIAYAQQPFAAFCLGRMEDSGTLRRVPEPHDRVGEMLERFLGGKQVCGGSAYLALWHKMRASCFLCCGRNKLARRHTLKALKHNPREWKLYAFLFLSLLPFGLGNHIIVLVYQNCTVN